jgi:hypothetical protein
MCSNVEAGDWDVVMGAPYLSHCLGKVYFEVQVRNPVGEIVVGLAGLNFESEWIGKDELSWGIDWEGSKVHRQEKTLSFSSKHHYRRHHFFFVTIVVILCVLSLGLYYPHTLFSLKLQ